MAQYPRPLIRLLLVPALVSFAACSSDKATGPEANLTPQQAAEALEAIATVTSIAFGGFGAVREHTGDATLLSEPVDESGPCPNGGSTRVRGSVSYNLTSGNVSADLRQTYADCGVTTESGKLWVFNGDPNVRVRFQTNISEELETFAFSGTQRGAFRFSTEELEGRCSVDLAFSMNDTGFTVSGTVCRQPVSETVSFGPLTVGD